MAWSVENIRLGVESRSGIVLPATEAYIGEAIEALKSGKVIAVPTDTLYGFACDACSAEAVNRIYEIKGRKHTSANLSGQASSVCIKDFKNLWEHCAYVYDGGVLPAGHSGSTIVDLTKLGKYRIVRPGSAKEETTATLEEHSLVEDRTSD